MTPRVSDTDREQSMMQRQRWPTTDRCLGAGASVNLRACTITNPFSGAALRLLTDKLRSPQGIYIDPTLLGSIRTTDGISLFI